jgi:hypothetical protein
MSILSAIKEARHESNNLEDLAKLPQTLIMSMVQNGQIEKDMLMPILGKKAEMADNIAKMNAAKALAAQGGAQPTVMDQYMGKIAQAENPAPPMPEQQMQQPMPQQMPQQQMAQQPMPQGPEDVGIATQATQPMSMAGGGIVAFDDGGDVDIDPDDNYQEMIDQAEEGAMNEEIYGLINQLNESVGRGERAAVGIRSGENKNIKEDTRERAKGGDKGDIKSRLLSTIMQKESGGRRYDKSGNLLTSSKGAEGEMQVMPYTAMDPGFGVKPAQNRSPDELKRVGDDYAMAMYSRYGDPKLAMIAYNMGPGATDKWLAAGADPRKLPKETQGYIRGVNLASGGEVKHFQAGGLGSEFGDTEQTYDMDTLRVQEALAARKRKEYEDQYEFLKQNAPGVAAKMAAPPPSETRPMVGYEAKGPKGKKVPTEEEAGAFLDRYSKPAAPSAATTPQQKAEEETFNLMQYVKQQQADRKEAAKMDKWQAGLAAGLGMLGGSSQYALEYIGKGGQMGVHQLAQSQKLRASQGIAGDKMLGTAYNAEMLNKLRKDQLAQGKEKADEDRAQRLITAKSTELGRRLKQKGITDEMIGMLEQKQMLKTIKPEELAKLNLFKQQMQRIKDDVNKEYSSDTSGFSARKIGQ